MRLSFQLKLLENAELEFQKAIGVHGCASSSDHHALVWAKAVPNLSKSWGGVQGPRLQEVTYRARCYRRTFNNSRRSALGPCVGISSFSL